MEQHCIYRLCNGFNSMVVESWMSDSTDWPVTPLSELKRSGRLFHISNRKFKMGNHCPVYFGPLLCWKIDAFINLRLNLSWYQLVVGVTAAARPVCPVHNADGITAFSFHSWSWCSHHHSLPKPFIWNYPLSTKTVGNLISNSCRWLGIVLCSPR